MKIRYNYYVKQQFIHLKEKAIQLRKQGKTYSEIRNELGKIPKGTLSFWFKSMQLTPTQQKRLEKIKTEKMGKGYLFAVEALKEKRKKHLENIRKRVDNLPSALEKTEVQKIAIAILYMGEGAKTRRGSLMLGNSDPQIIKLFLKLLRSCYHPDERKLRCIVQCRADQNVEELEQYWTKITKIPRTQFYKTRIDPRTIGRPSRKLDYKGVCRIEYFSADVYNELKMIASVLTETL